MASAPPHLGIGPAFREVTLCLMGLYHLYEVSPELERATASALERVFRSHWNAIQHPRAKPSPLRGLLNEVEKAQKENET